MTIATPSPRKLAALARSILLENGFQEAPREWRGYGRSRQQRAVGSGFHARCFSHEAIVTFHGPYGERAPLHAITDVLLAHGLAIEQWGGSWLKVVG